MRFATYEYQGIRRIGVVSGNEIADITSTASDMRSLIARGDEGVAAANKAAASASRVMLSAVKLLSPIPRPANTVFCVGLNYKEHVAEGAKAGVRPTDDAPQYPVWFSKSVTAVCGPYDDIVIDNEVSTKYDWEVELAVIIGRPGRRIRRESAFDHVYGYSVINDFSVRDIQRRHGPPPQWFKGKSWERGTPLGPWIVTRDEFATPPQIEVICRVNGVEKQRSNTRLMIFDIPAIVADLSEVMTLESGDIIASGTPSGVGFARTPPEYLAAGDVMETEVEGIGVLRNRIVNRRP